MDDLHDDNAEAWALFHRLYCRFAVDLQVTGLFLGAAVEMYDPDDRLDLLQRLSIIYDVVYPPTKKQQR